MGGCAFWLVAGMVLATDQPAQGPAGKDMHGLAGTWQAVSMVVNGRPMPEGQVENMRLVLGDGTFRQEEYGYVVRQGTVTLHPEQKPPQIDLTYRGDEGKDQSFQGIYELQGGRLKICQAYPAVPRPTAFISKPDTGHVLLIYERKKS